MTEPELVIAHQLGKPLADRLAATLPPGVRLLALPPAAAYEVPDEAEVLIAVPPRGQVHVPSAAPAGWPHRLSWAHTASVGVDEFPRWLFEVPLVTCARGVNSGPVAEFAIASMLAHEKRFPAAWIDRAEAWGRIDLGTLGGKTLGILGFGSIGETLARLALPFGMQVVAHRRSGGETSQTGVTIVDLPSLLAHADHLVVAMPLTAETRHMLDRTAFDAMKPGVHLVNISRGGIIDQDALLAALESGKVAAASLDVTEPEPLPAGHPLYAHSRVHLSPHISWGGALTSAMLDGLVENIRRYRAGQKLLDRVEPARGY